MFRLNQASDYGSAIYVISGKEVNDVELSSPPQQSLITALSLRTKLERVSSLPYSLVLLFLTALSLTIWQLNQPPTWV